MASAQVKSCLLFAGLLAEGETRVVEPLPSRDHTERMLAAAGRRGRPRGRRRSRSGPPARLEPGEIVVPGDFSSAAFFIVAGAARARQRGHASTGSGSTRPAPACSTILERMGAEIEVEPRASAAASRSGRSRVSRRRAARRPRSAAPRCRWRSTSCRWSRSPPASPRGDDDPRRRRAAAQGVRPDRDRDRGADRARRRGRGDRGRDGRSRAAAACAAARSTPTATTGSRCWRVAGLASREGVEVEGMDAAAVSYPGFEADLASLLAAA